MLWFCVLFFGVFVQGNLECGKGATLKPTTAMLTCNGAMTVYVDGVQVNHKASNYTIAQETTIPLGSTVLAVHCHNSHRPPKILGTIGVSILTASKGWVCTGQHYPAWNTTQFVDTSWAPAVAYKKNVLDIPYGKVQDIPDAAEWIGSQNGTDSLYCRFSLCPKKVCVSIHTTRIDNHKLDGFIFDKFDDQNVGECAMKCFADNRCRSFNYISSSPSGNCELNNSSELLGSTHLIQAPGVTYYYRNN